MFAWLEVGSQLSRGFRFDREATANGAACEGMLRERQLLSLWRAGMCFGMYALRWRGAPRRAVSCRLSDWID
jgi:hypothetical protein